MVGTLATSIINIVDWRVLVRDGQVVCVGPEMEWWIDMGCGGYRNGYITMAMFLSFILFYFILINHYSYSDYLAYDGRPHLHVGIPTSKPVSAPHPLVTYRRREKTKQKTIGNKTI